MLVAIEICLHRTGKCENEACGAEVDFSCVCNSIKCERTLPAVFSYLNLSVNDLQMTLV